MVCACSGSACEGEIQGRTDRANEPLLQHDCSWDLTNPPVSTHAPPLGSPLRFYTLGGVDLIQMCERGSIVALVVLEDFCKAVAVESENFSEMHFQFAGSST